MNANRRKQRNSQPEDFDITPFLPNQESGMKSAVESLLARKLKVVGSEDRANQVPAFSDEAPKAASLTPIGVKTAGLMPDGLVPFGLDGARAIDGGGRLENSHAPINAHTGNLPEGSAGWEATAPNQGNSITTGPDKPEVDLAPIGLKPVGFEPDGWTGTGKSPRADSPIGSGSGGVKQSPHADSVSLGDVLAQLATRLQPTRARGKLFRASRVEDGHSATQDRLYWFLWRQGQHVKGSRSKFIQAGYGQIQAALKIDRSNVQDAVRELQKKLSVRVVQSSTVGAATVYEVFSCDDILSKRREQGMLWVRCFGTRRVDFVSPDALDSTSDKTESEVSPIPSTPIGFTDMGISPSYQKPAVGNSHIVPNGFTPIPPVGVTPIQQVKLVTASNSTTAVASIVRTLHDELGQTDDEAARRIIQECRRRAPDATESEIAFQVRVQAKRLRGKSSIENPIGLLITQVPKCFEEEALKRFRIGRSQNSQGREEEQVEFTTAQQRQEYQSILEDPMASEAEKRLARNLLE